MPSTLVFDGDCAFCTSSARLLERLRARPTDYDVRPWQDCDLAAWGLTEQECLTAVQWVTDDGVYAAVPALARALQASRWWVRPLGALLLAPGIRQVADVGYRWVARNRHRLPGGTPACALPPRS